MTNWLKWRLCALVGGAVLIGGAGYLHAQNDHPAPAKTPEEAATNFFKLLDILRQPPSIAPAGDETTIHRLVGSVKRAQFEALESDRSGDAGSKALQHIAEQAVAQPFEAHVQSSEGSQTIVAVTPSIKPKSREVVVIQEDGGYRVDVVATYGRWNQLSGLDADKALLRETGWISPTLAKQPAFLGGATLPSCQSNLKQLGLGIAMYTQDYDEVLPPARRWGNKDVLMPYLKNEQLFTCPALAANGKSKGYAYNSKVSQISLSRINLTAQTIELYETSNLGPSVFAPFTGRAYRHTQNGKEGMNICFTDGHVKWYARGKSEQLTIEPTIANPGYLTISAKTR